MITRFNNYDSLIEKNIFTTHGSIIMIFKNIDEFYIFKNTLIDEVSEFTSTSIDRDFKNGVMTNLDNNQTPYIRYNANNGRLSYGSLEFLKSNYGDDFDESFHMEDLTKFINLIKNKGEYEDAPTYKPRQFIREDYSINENYFDDYESIILVIDNNADISPTIQKINDELDGILEARISDSIARGVREYNNDGEIPYIRYLSNVKRFKYGTIGALEGNNNSSTFTFEKYFHVGELNTIINLIKKGGQILPTYQPKKFIRESKDGNYSDSYSHIPIQINNLEELNIVHGWVLKEINPQLRRKVTSDYYDGVKRKLDSDIISNYIYYFGEGIIKYGPKDWTVDHPREFNIERFYTVDELDDVKYIIKNDKYPEKMPSYRPRRFVRENKEYFKKYPDIVIELKDREEVGQAFNYINEEIYPVTHTPILDSCNSGSINYLEDGKTPIFVYVSGGDSWMYGSKEHLLQFPGTASYLKIYNINNLYEIKNLIINKDNDIVIPSYEPKTFIKENFNELLLERSSLTKLGIPREVMQPIQRDLALSPDAEWEKMEHKKDILDYLRKGDANLFVQIGIDNIKVIVSYPSPKGTQFFIDNYVYRDTDWTGEFEKLKREYKTLTQTAIEIEPRTNIYRLDGDFSINKQAQRKMRKKEKSFMDFSDKFKTDFLQKFDKILKRISGTSFKKAKDKVTDKAKKIAMENSLLIKGLDNPLNGPNGLSILDEFLYQFEDAYSEYFEERIDIQELTKYFTADKVMTMFMYYIYTGKILVN